MPQIVTGSDKGCPTTCYGCVPFCCTNKLEIQKFIEPKNIGKSTYQLAEVVISICFPVAGVAIGIYELIKPVINWVNVTINKKRLEEEQKKITEDSIKSIAFHLQAYLECRIGWCKVVSKFPSLPVFASNSPTFGSQGPEMGKQVMIAYIEAARQLNNARFGKTIQKILDAGKTIDYEENTNVVRSGLLKIKVPNIEAYWQDDEILLPGITGKKQIVHRIGSAANRKLTWDCDSTFIDDSIAPTNIRNKGRGCQLAFTSNYDGQANSGGGGRTGVNIRNLTGEGWLVINTAYSSSYDSLKGKTVQLNNPIFISDVGIVTTPPPTTQNTTPKPPASSPKAPAANISIEEPKSNKAMFSTIGSILLIGVGVTFFIKAVTKKNYETEVLSGLNRRKKRLPIRFQELR